MEEHLWSRRERYPHPSWGIHSPAVPIGPGGKNPRPASLPNWLILDRFVHRSSRAVEDEEDGTASKTSYTCTGRPIRASLRVADSPAVSRLYLHWPGRREFERMPEPYVIAAHHHSILFKALVPLEDDMSRDDSFYFPVDFFVYSAFSSPPSLHRLPACLTGGISAPEEDEFFRPYRRRQQRPMLESYMGILCHGNNGEFTVADLTKFTIPEAELCLLHHRAPASSSAIETEWKIRKVRLPVSSPVPLDLYSWRTDAVIPIADRFLCWVDYYQGMLIVDILLANDESSPDQQLRYIPLPKEALGSPRQYPEGDCHDPSRCVCVQLKGVRFVCITNVLAGQAGYAPRAPFRVSSWTLYDFYQGKWLKDGTMDCAEFRGLYGKVLPRVRPSYPLVNMFNPYAIFFLLKEDCDILWIIEVNMREKILNSCALYIEEETEEEKEEGCPTKIVPRNIFCGHSFIFSQFSTCLRKDATRSVELSKMMQKAKELRVMQKRDQLEAEKLKGRVKVSRADLAVKCRA